MAEIVNLVDARASRAAATHRADMGADAEKLRTFQLLAQIRRNLGLAPDYRGDLVVTRRPTEEIGPQPKKSLVLRRIEEVADVFGIDVSSPERQQP